MYIPYVKALYIRYVYDVVWWDFDRKCHRYLIVPDEELFSETAVGCTASYFNKNLWCSCWFCNPPPYFEAEYCLFCGRRRVAVARYRMICLVLITISFVELIENV